MEHPHVYVIHLKDREDRKQQFEKAWAAAELPKKNLYWVPAVRGINLSDTEIGQFYTHARSYRARAGRVGCYCSHVKAIERAIRLNHFPLLILEDDSLPAEPMELSRLFASAPTEANLLYFGALLVKKRKTIKAQKYCSRKTYGWSRPSRGLQLYGGHAYGFRTASAAQDVLNLLKEKPMTFDSALIRYQKLHPEKISLHCPFRFFQSEGFSNIEGKFLLRGVS